ncbi:MAG: peptide ABC transporter substrate-binding protein, partial [Anaerolineae bacterium]|nr:peptide ABC transporter substrate-binding protein [Anaerolineae bacterium]
KETVIVEGTSQVVEKEVERVVTATPEPQVAKGTVVVGVWQEPKGLIWNIFYEAHTNDILDSMYYAPIGLDANDELIPELLVEVPTVENGGISEDGTVITVKFKDGVKWHDGEPVTSADLKFTWEFVVDPATLSQTSAGWDQIKSIETPDDLTAVITFDKPYVPFVAAALTFPVLPKHALEGVTDPGNSDFARNPIGNGAFVFQEWIPGDHITVVANPDALVPPKIEKIIFKFVPDMNTLIALLRTGDVDVAYDLRELQIAEVLKMDGVEPFVVPGISIERYYFNLRDRNDLSKPHPIFSDLEVRQAIAMGMDRFTAVSSILQGYGEVAVTELDNHPWFNEELTPVPYDPEAAMAMLDEAGWVDSDGDGIRDKDSMKLSFGHSTTSGNQVRENLQVFFQQNLKDIGVEMIIENHPAATLFGGCADSGVFGTGNFDMMGFTNKPASIDLAQEWSDFFLCAAVKDCETNPAGSNAWGYCDEEADAALQCAVNELDGEKRVACIKEAQKLIYDDMVALYVYDRLDVYAANERIGGFNPTVFGSWTWNFSDWYVIE